MSAIAEDASRLLAELGDHEVTVAATLHLAGITGTPTNAGNCPIAAWLARHDMKVTVGLEAVHVAPLDADPDDDSAWVFFDPPEAVTAFIRAFDDELYPQLVDQAAAAHEQALAENDLRDQLAVLARRIYADWVRAAGDEQLAHLAEHAEALPPSRVCAEMRACVDAELDRRHLVLIGATR